jgi:hypothetical protein
MRLSKSMLLVLLLTVSSAAAYAADIPLNNWTPAPFASSSAAKSGPRLNLTSNASTSSFMPLAPCRVYDSRTSGPATPLAGSSSRTIDVDAGSACTGIPNNAAAYSLNITAFGSTAGAAYGFVTAYATGTTRPTTSTMNFLLGSQTSNAATVPVGTSGDIDLFTTVTTHFTLDINGYYTVNQAAGNGFASVSSNGIGVFGQSSTNYGVEGYSTGSYGVVGFTNATAAAGVAGSSSSGSGVYGISGTNIGVHGLSTDYNGVWADSTNWDAVAAFGGRDGGYFQGVRHGAVGVSTTTGAAGQLFGVTGSQLSTSAGAAGVAGTSIASPHANYLTYMGGPAGLLGLSTTGYGVFGASQDAYGGKFIAEDATGVEKGVVYLAYNGGAGSFWGNVQVNAWAGQTGNLAVQGTLSKGAGSFKIDDPIDPENKYLYHSFVESPDMMNIYNGVVELDSAGVAVVQLPKYFEALNRDFRYQLTSIGRPQPNLYIADEVADNQFRIAGGHGGAKVSWTVTGIRHDPFANVHRIPNEIDKDTNEKGLYLHPAEYGKTPEQGIGRKLQKIMDDPQQSKVRAEQNQ